MLSVELVCQQQSFTVIEFHATEAVAASFEWLLTLRCDDDVWNCLHHSAELRIVGLGQQRIVHGVVCEIVHSQHHHWQCYLRSRLVVESHQDFWFENVSVAAAIHQVMTEQGFQSYQLQFHAHCFQHQHLIQQTKPRHISTLNWLSALASNIGFLWWWLPNSAVGEQIQFCSDWPAAQAKLPTYHDNIDGLQPWNEFHCQLTTQRWLNQSPSMSTIKYCMEEDVFHPSSSSAVNTVECTFVSNFFMLCPGQQMVWQHQPFQILTIAHQWDHSSGYSNEITAQPYSSATVPKLYSMREDAWRSATVIGNATTDTFDERGRYQLQFPENIANARGAPAIPSVAAFYRDSKNPVGWQSRITEDATVITSHVSMQPHARFIIGVLSHPKANSTINRDFRQGVQYFTDYGSGWLIDDNPLSPKLNWRLKHHTVIALLAESTTAEFLVDCRNGQLSLSARQFFVVAGGVWQATAGEWMLQSTSHIAYSLHAIAFKAKQTSINAEHALRWQAHDVQLEAQSAMSLKVTASITSKVSSCVMTAQSLTHSCDGDWLLTSDQQGAVTLLLGATRWTFGSDGVMTITSPWLQLNSATPVGFAGSVNVT